MRPSHPSGATGPQSAKKEDATWPAPFATHSGETLQFERLAFDANAAFDSLRPERPFPLPLKEARALFMPLFVLAELRRARRVHSRRRKTARKSRRWLGVAK